MAQKKKVSKRSPAAAKKRPSRTAPWRNDGRAKAKPTRSEGPLEPTEIITEKSSGEDRRVGGERRILPDRRKSA